MKATERNTLLKKYRHSYKELNLNHMEHKVVECHTLVKIYYRYAMTECSDEENRKRRESESCELIRICCAMTREKGKKFV